MAAVDEARRDVPVKPGIFTHDDFAADEVALRGSRCRACDEAFFPARQVCPRCRSRDAIADVALGRAGTVHALTHVTRPPAHYDDAYVLAEVDLAEGVRLVAHIVAEAGDAVAPGDAVTLVVRPQFALPDGRRVWGYQFRPAGSVNKERAQ